MDGLHTQLHLKDLKVITGALKSIVCKSFGPKGGHTLLVSSTGQVNVTHDGALILSALKLSHPIARLIVDCVKSFGKTCGDGCKTFIIYVHELLSIIDMSFTSLNFSSSDDLSYRNTVLKSLYEFTNADLLDICGKVQEFVNVQNCKENTYCKAFEDAVYFIVLSCFTGLPSKVCVHLTRNVTALINAAERSHNLRMILYFLDNHLLMLPNQLYIDSHISDGIFLLGSFFGQQSSAYGVKLMFLQCPLEGFVDKESTDAVSVTCTSRESFFTYRLHVARKFLHCVKCSGVSLLLTTHAVPGYIMQICSEFNINILACLENKDLEFITYITGKLPISNVHESFCEKSNIVNIDSWEYVVKSGKHFVKIIFNKCCTKYTPKYMFLCAPTECLCQQLKLLVKKSITVVDSYFSHSLLNLSMREIVYSRNTEFSDLNTAEASPNLTPWSKCLFQIADKELYINNVNFDSKQSRLTLNNVIAGGGYFENVMIHFLHCYNQNDILCHKQYCCRIIIKMLESVPKALFDNLCSFQSCQIHNFLCKQKEVMEAIKSGVNTQTTCTSLENGVIDVLSIKFDVLFAAINLVVKLLQIETIVGIKRLVNGGIQESQLQLDNDIE